MLNKKGVAHLAIIVVALVIIGSIIWYGVSDNSDAGDGELPTEPVFPGIPGVGDGGDGFFYPDVRECAEDRDCEEIDENYPNCDDGICVDYCLNHDDCPTNEYCKIDEESPGFNECVDCLEDSHCPSTEKPICSLSEFSSGNTCVVCYTPGMDFSELDSYDEPVGCPDPSKPVCYINKECVECTLDRHCKDEGATLCSSNRECVQCVDEDDESPCELVGLVCVDGDTCAECDHDLSENVRNSQCPPGEVCKPDNTCELDF